MCMKRGLMPEESARLMEIYQSQDKLSLHDVIEQYASDEYKALIEEAKKEEEIVEF